MITLTSRNIYVLAFGPLKRTMLRRRDSFSVLLLPPNLGSTYVPYLVPSDWFSILLSVRGFHVSVGTTERKMFGKMYFDYDASSR